jgi:hypothetical protein
MGYPCGEHQDVEKNGCRIVFVLNEVIVITLISLLQWSVGFVFWRVVSSFFKMVIQWQKLYLSLPPCSKLPKLSPQLCTG